MGKRTSLTPKIIDDIDIPHDIIKNNRSKIEDDHVIKKNPDEYISTSRNID